MLEQTDLAYIAGIIDGEGNISLIAARVKRPVPKSGPARPEARTAQYDASGTRLRHFLGVGVGMTDELIPMMLKNAFGGSIYYYENRPGWKGIWRWLITSNKALAFLRAIQPYLRLKVAQAEIAIQFQEARHPNRLTPEQRTVDQQLWEVMHSLNLRGSATPEPKQRPMTLQEERADYEV